MVRGEKFIQILAISSPSLLILRCPFFLDRPIRSNQKLGCFEVSKSSSLSNRSFRKQSIRRLRPVNQVHKNARQLSLAGNSEKICKRLFLAYQYLPTTDSCNMMGTDFGCRRESRNALRLRHYHATIKKLEPLKVLDLSNE